MKPSREPASDDVVDSSETETGSTPHPLQLLAALSIAFAEATLDPNRLLELMSHELRTPLTTIQLSLQGILAANRQEGRAPGSDWSLAALSAAERETARLVHLVDDLLDVSRLAAGRLKFDVMDLDLCDLVRSIVDRFEAQAEEARCPVRLVSPTSLRGSWDPNRIDQVLTNLLTNAIKFGRG
jgi:signal transduction histidine kinase